MGRINVEVDDELLKEFKIKIIRKYGTVKGNLPKAVMESIKLWIEKGGV